MNLVKIRRKGDLRRKEENMKIHIKDGLVEINKKTIIKTGMSLESFEQMLMPEIPRLRLKENESKTSFFLEKVLSSEKNVEFDVNIIFTENFVRKVFIREHIDKVKMNQLNTWGIKELNMLYERNNKHFSEKIDGEKNKYGFYSFSWGRIALVKDNVALDSYIEIEYK